MAPVDPEAQKQIMTVLTVEKVREHNETRAVLDVLRRTRKSRGGVGAPLEVPPHLRSSANGQGIIVTDADLRPDTPLPASLLLNGNNIKVEN